MYLSFNKLCWKRHHDIFYILKQGVKDDAIFEYTQQEKTQQLKQEILVLAGLSFWGGNGMAVQNTRLLAKTALVWLVICSFLLLPVTPVSADGPTELPAGTISDTLYQIFLPSVSNGIGIALIYPTNNANIDTLSPKFFWSFTGLSAELNLFIVFGTDPKNLSLAGTLTTATNMIFLTYNLEPQTRYYWRIGVSDSMDLATAYWSETCSFVTPAASSGTLPAAPALHSPINGYYVLSREMVFTWQAVAGADEYLMVLQSPNTGQYTMFYNIFSNSAYVTDLEEVINSNGDSTVIWAVKARNNFGWSSFSNVWLFYVNIVPSPNCEAVTSVQPEFRLLQVEQPDMLSLPPFMPVEKE
jgi:hypothetical protein